MKTTACTTPGFPTQIFAGEDGSEAAKLFADYLRAHGRPCEIGPVVKNEIKSEALYAPRNLGAAERVEWERTLRIGEAVLVYWGWGSGFRARGRGKIAKIFRTCVQVELTADVPDSHGGAWPKGRILKGIPLFAHQRWHPFHTIWPLMEQTWSAAPTNV